ncbi:MAG: peptidylprolyl isomerase [Bacteroidales bacterium]|nr:peptidylprolyl isomerase [Bacteroidales bacterium]
MKRFLVKVFVFILAACIQLSAWTQSEDNRVLISIGDEDITVSEFLNVYQKNNVNTDLADKKSMEEYLELYVNFRLKVKEARDLGMDTAKAFIEELAGYRKQLAEPYFNDQEVTDELLQEAYNRLMYDIRASHILVKVDENALPADTLKAYNKIMDVRKRLLAGEDFASVAAEVSDDPSAHDRPAQGQSPARKGNGGDLGYFTVFDMVYPFETGAYSTPVGEISMPVRTAYGYHLIKVTDKREALGKATVAHLYLALPKNASAQDSARKEQEINELYQRIVDGEKFEELVLQYSDDRGSKEKGGLLPRFGSNRMVPEFIVAVSGIKDSAGISKPVLTSFGWHILKLIDRKKPGDYKVEVLELKRRMSKDVRANKSRETVIKRIKTENGFKEYPENLNDLKEAIDSSFLAAEWSAEKVSHMNKKIFQLGKEKYTQHDFGQYLENMQKRRATAAFEPFFFDQYHDFVNEKCIQLKDSQLEKQYPEFRMLMNEYRDGILLFNLTDERVWSKAVQDTAGLKEFYESNRKQYMWDERIEADLVIINDPAMEADVRRLISRSMAREQSYAEQGLDTMEQVSIKSGIFAKGDNDFVDQLDWNTIGQTEARNLADFNALYDGKQHNENSLIFAVIHKVIAPEPKALNEARGIITSDYQNYLEKEWVRKLKETYPVEIHEEVFEDIQ